MSQLSQITNGYRIYKGNPTNEANIHSIQITNHPKGYKPSDALIDAVNVSILLGKPLLLTGEPGTGKTQLAFNVANELQLGEFNEMEGVYKPYKFVAKHNSVAKDLFYTYNYLQHFTDANHAKANGDSLDRTATDYITYQALGKAIQRADNSWTESKGITPQRSVVLIDEIDKAPLEFPNDLLDELEEMRFEVPEILTSSSSGSRSIFSFTADKGLKPIVIITSNEEKILPDAFLRRCTYFHIEFPDRENLFKIVDRRLNQRGNTLRFSQSQLDFLLDHFFEVREACKNKKPSTSDLISWLQVLDHYSEFDIEKLKQSNKLSNAEKHVLMMTYTVLLKHEVDLKRIKKSMDLN